MGIPAAAQALAVTSEDSGSVTLHQIAGGIHMRLRARAFVFQDRDATTGQLGKQFAFVSADIGVCGRGAVSAESPSHGNGGPGAHGEHQAGCARPARGDAGRRVCPRPRIYFNLRRTWQSRLAHITSTRPPLVAGMASDLVTQKVVEGLEAQLPGVYSYENLCISGTHTHSSAAGFLQCVAGPKVPWLEDFMLHKKFLSE